MRRLGAALLLWFGLASAALAQNFTMPPPAGVVVAGWVVVASCGGQSLTAGQAAFGTMDVTGKLCDQGTGSGTVTANQGNKGTNAQAWWVEIGDGTNGPAAVKPASTAPISSDPSLVVGINPNSINANGQATKANSAPVTIASDQGSIGALSSDYASGATPITASATGTTAATTATLAGTSGKTTYICGFVITSDATALTTGTATVTGTVSGTLSFIQTVLAVTSGAAVLNVSFSKCIPASAANTSIAVNSIAAGTGGNTAVSAWGYQL